MIYDELTSKDGGSESDKARIEEIKLKSREKLQNHEKERGRGFLSPYPVTFLNFRLQIVQFCV